jgi:hypothetical protein
MTQPEPLSPAFLDQYKLAVEMADRVSARRATANSFFVTVQSALVAAFGFSNDERWPLAVAGIVVAAAWWLSLRSYRMLNAAKFDVINKMEECLPVAPYKDEWAILDSKDGPLHKRYAALSLVEQTVPVAFMALNFGLLMLAL